MPTLLHHYSPGWVRGACGPSLKWNTLISRSPSCCISLIYSCLPIHLLLTTSRDPHLITVMWNNLALLINSLRHSVMFLWLLVLRLITWQTPHWLWCWGCRRALLIDHSQERVGCNLIIERRAHVPRECLPSAIRENGLNDWERRSRRKSRGHHSGAPEESLLFVCLCRLGVFEECWLK